MYTNDTERLFAEGGMNDQGGTVDPVSGNEVPPGSLQNEVRDDIDAKLSEGEFVIPADVVRYIGLERLMKLRDEAKQGLSRMAEIGQMGNADQVENPEALHEGDKEFESEIDDIMSEVDGEEMGEPKFARGGVVKVPEASKDILAKYNIQRTAITNPANDVRLLKNAAGDSLYMTYFNGKPSGKIPAGYSVVDANPSSRMAGPATTPAAPATGAANPTNIVATGGGGGRPMPTSITPNTINAVNVVTPDVPAEKPATTTPAETTTTTTPSGPAVNADFMGDKGQGVNSYGGSITATDTGAVSTGIGGFTLNPDGSVTPNTIDRTVMTVAGMVNPLLSVAGRVNNALATSSAKAFSAAIADTGGTNLNATQPAATAGPVSAGGTGGTAATAASQAASEATSSGMSSAAVGAASQAAANTIVKGGSASEAAQAGRDAANTVANTEAKAAEPASQQTATDIALGGQGGSAGADSLTSGEPTAGRQDTGGGEAAVGGGEAAVGGGETGGGGGEAGGGETAVGGEAAGINDGGYCPAPWINILLANGSTVKAGDIKPGMEVYTRHETTNEWGSYPVSAVEMSEDTRWEVLLEDGRSFVGSSNHRVHTGNDWTEINALKAGDKLVQPEGVGIVKSSTKLDHGPVVKITVEDAHTYISEGFLSHNVKKIDSFSEESEYIPGASMTAVDGFGSSFAAKPFDQQLEVAAFAKGGLVAKRSKKPTAPRKKGLVSKR